MRFAATIAAAIAGGLALPAVGFLGWDINSRTVQSGLPGAVIPGWQLSVMDAGADLSWPSIVRQFCGSARQFTGPYWTPSKAQAEEAATALREFLDARAARLDDAMLREVELDGACDSAMDLWKSRDPDREFARHGTPVHREWLEMWDACDAAVVASQFETYRAQYLGVGHNGRRAVLINAYCDPAVGGFVERLAPYIVVDGGPCYFEAYYSTDIGTIEALWVH